VGESGSGKSVSALAILGLQTPENSIVGAGSEILFGGKNVLRLTPEELLRIWAASTGTNALARRPGDPLPRLALDGIAVVEMNDAGLCAHFRLWWHSVVANS